MFEPEAGRGGPELGQAHLAAAGRGIDAEAGQSTKHRAVWDLYEAGAWLVAPTNTSRNQKGAAIMGAGIAGAIAKRFPELPVRYGKVLAGGGKRMVDTEHRLLLAPTKTEWRAPAQLALVDELLDAVATWARKDPDASVVLPALGCGLGGLDFNEVRRRAQDKLSGAHVTLVGADGETYEMDADSPGQDHSATSRVPFSGLQIPAGDAGPAELGTRSRQAEAPVPVHHKPLSVIERFDGRWRFLSNYFDSPVSVAGISYPSGEHAFNAAKTLNRTEVESIRSARTPGEAKRAGRRVALRDGWDGKYRYEAMRSVVEAKFADEALRSLLLGTGDALLVEGNTHHDQHWGDCSCPKHRAWPGHNHLGRMLMAERSRLRGDPEPGGSGRRVARVMVSGHRPQFLTEDQASWARAELGRLAVKVRSELGGSVAISGMAVGADTWWAMAALEAGLELWAYIPFEAQPDKWRPAEQATWGDLRSRSSREVVLGGPYDVRLLHARNDLMIRDADLVIAVGDPAKDTGGTASTIKKAIAAGKAIISVDVVERRTTLRLASTDTNEAGST